jgi:hypothetical protein
LDWSLFYVTYSVYIKERTMAQQKYSTLYSRNFMEFRGFLPHKPPFCNLIVHENTTKPSTNLENHKRKPMQRKQMLLLKSRNLASHQSRTSSYTTTLALHQPQGIGPSQNW